MSAVKLRRVISMGVGENMELALAVTALISFVFASCLCSFVVGYTLARDGRKKALQPIFADDKGNKKGKMTEEDEKEEDLLAVGVNNILSYTGDEIYTYEPSGGENQ